MKDGRTHLAHKAEHAVDMETGAIVADTHGDEGVKQVSTDGPREVVTDKGYHSRALVNELTGSLSTASLLVFCGFLGFAPDTQEVASP